MPTAATVFAQKGITNPHPLMAAAAIVPGVPLWVAAAFTEKESRGANIYGHDVGGTMYGAGPVTAANFARFYQLVVVQGERSNGVGPLQITYRGYFPVAARDGYRLWVPFDNYRFGLGIIARNLAGDYSTARLERAGTLYNAGNLTNGINAYGRDLAVKARVWRTVLTGATLPRVLRQGMSGGDVVALQGGLIRRFPTYASPIVSKGGADGSFGPGTAAVVAEFQRRVKLPPDATVGPWTRGRLSEYGITP